MLLHIQIAFLLQRSLFPKTGEWHAVEGSINQFVQGAAEPVPSQRALLDAGSTLDLRSTCSFGYFFCTSAPADCSRLFHISFKQSYYFTDPGLLFADELDAVHCSWKYCFATLNASHSFSVAIGFITADMQLSLILDAAAIHSLKPFLYIGLQIFQPGYHGEP